MDPNKHPTPEDVAIRKNYEPNYPGRAAYAGQIRPKLSQKYASILHPDMGKAQENGEMPPINTAGMLPNPIQFHAANEARSNADFAAAAPAALPKTEPPQISYTDPAGKSGTITSGLGTQAPERQDQENGARRSAYVGRQQRLSDYLYPGMDQSSFGRDANTRANAESGANVAATNAETKYVTPAQGNAIDAGAGLTREQTNRIRLMTPGDVAGQGIANDTNKAMIQPKVNAANAAATAGPERLKFLTDEMVRHKQRGDDFEKQVGEMRRQMNVLNTQIRLYQQGHKGNLLEEAEAEVAAEEAKAKGGPAGGAQPPQQTQQPQPTQQPPPQQTQRPATTQPAAQAGRFPTPEEIQQIMAEAPNDPDRQAQIAISRGLRVTR